MLNFITNQSLYITSLLFYKGFSLQEGQAAAAQAKYRKAVAEVEDAEDRAMRAEKALMGRARVKAGAR